MSDKERYYAPNGVIYQDGQPVGFYDTQDTLGMMTEEEEQELREFRAKARDRAKP